jgi:transcriptional regulator of aromatic amino acid metabolism
MLWTFSFWKKDFEKMNVESLSLPPLKNPEKKTLEMTRERQIFIQRAQENTVPWMLYNQNFVKAFFRWNGKSYSPRK